MCVEGALGELGYKIEVTEFDDFVVPNTVLLEGTVECNWFQHEQYIFVYKQMAFAVCLCYNTLKAFISDISVSGIARSYVHFF